MNVAIIAAAGQGTRMAGKRPKQFLELAGTPIIFHTLKAFEQCDVFTKSSWSCPQRSLRAFFRWPRSSVCESLRRVVPGGATRAESVKRGLQAVRAATAEIVAVHDGVRPFVTAEEIDANCCRGAERWRCDSGRARVDTIKEVSDGAVVKTLNRDDLRAR